jgi:hypothetical protein
MERQFRVADGNLLTMAQRMGRRDPDIVDQRAVGTAQIREDVKSSFSGQAGVVTGDLWFWQPQIIVLGPANGEFGLQLDFLGNLTAYLDHQMGWGEMLYKRGFIFHHLLLCPRNLGRL